ncbi:hypothetical protein RB623_07825 [Mesorhizobium sp. LHD-90]|uniref:D-apionate lactonase n=1 Tax=Mesorhizobium sp. LHD-90 TaxID=3071414 RepID=UPI0027E0943E|nr:hypothetical protein [Mesorhizobium sp. LHD-90]MDQ6433952.1 hypothetical protein [Mesorhizobium sp. LHD-90]
MTDTFILTGTHQVEETPVRLSAGLLTADFTGGNLRSIRYDSIEVLRAIAFIVRDQDWGTYAPVVSNLRVEHEGGTFAVSYDARCVAPNGSVLGFRASITASAKSLVFDVTALPDGDFETNRCGFCILHPIVGLAGEPVTIEHIDGGTVETKLPYLIDPWQPFKSMRAITHQVMPGLRAECRMEGDSFEMEDQRNWSDASYKTYVRPLELPWPYVMPDGRENRQTITLRFLGAPDAAVKRKANDAPIPLALGSEGPRLPEVGIVVYPSDVAETSRNIDRLKRLGPQSLLLHFDPIAGHGIDDMRAFASLVDAYPVPATLEIVLPCRHAPAVELVDISAMVAAAGLKLAAVVVSPAVDRQSTPPGSKWPDCPPLEEVYAAARKAFPGVRLGGGMLSYFTELNRKRVPAGRLDFITHCTNPIVHTADDLSVMESLEALPFITASTRAIYGDKPYRIGPSTIAMRQNPYGSRTKDNPDNIRIAMADRDPRHSGLFGAAWAVGYMARVAAAGLEQLVLSSLTGPFGLVAGAGESVTGQGLRPLAHIVGALAARAGLTSIAVATDERRLAAVAVKSASGGTVVLMANLTPLAQVVDVSSVAGAGQSVEILDAESVAASTGWRTEKVAGGTLPLAPYAVARTD